MLVNHSTMSKDRELIRFDRNLNMMSHVKNKSEIHKKKWRIFYKNIRVTKENKKKIMYARFYFSNFLFSIVGLRNTMIYTLGSNPLFRV